MVFAKVVIDDYRQDQNENGVHQHNNILPNYSFLLLEERIIKIDGQ